MSLQYNVVSPAPPGSTGLGGLPWFGGVQLGPDTTTNFVLTPAGLGVCRPDGTCVAIDRDLDTLLDVTPLVIPGVSPGVVRLPLPLRSVRRGDLLITSDAPFAALFVGEVEEGTRIRGLDPVSGEYVVYSPPRGLILNMAVVAISVFSDGLMGRRRRDQEDDKREPRSRLFGEALLFAALSGPGQSGGVASAGTGRPTVPMTSTLASLTPLLLLDVYSSGDEFGRGRCGLGELLLLTLLPQLYGQAPPANASGTVSQSPPPATANPIFGLLPFFLGSRGGGGAEDDGNEAPRLQFRETLIALAAFQGLGWGGGGATSVPGQGAPGSPSAGPANPLWLMLALIAGRSDFSQWFGGEMGGRGRKPERGADRPAPQAGAKDNEQGEQQN